MIRRVVMSGLAIAVLMAAPATAQSSNEVVVAITPTSIDIALGETVGIKVTVTNRGESSLGSLAVHIDVTDPTSASSVDPEDWTPTLTRQVPPLAPGQSVDVPWEIQPISGGSFSLYAVVLAASSPDVTVSNAVAVHVTYHRTLNPQGVLPVAIASPLVIGALLIFTLRRRFTAGARRAR